MFEIIEKEIYNIKFNYTKLENYYNYVELKQNCFEILLYINKTDTICDTEKKYLSNLIFSTYNDIISIWKYDAISKGDI